MLSLTLQLCSSTEGRALYRGPSCRTLEVKCTSNEIRVSALPKDGDQLPCQFRISIPAGLFEPFYASISNGVLSCEDDPKSNFSNRDSDCFSVGYPMNDITRQILNGDFHPSISDSLLSQCQQGDTAELASRLSTLTTDVFHHSSDIGSTMKTLDRPTSLTESENSDQTLASRLASLNISETNLLTGSLKPGSLRVSTDQSVTGLSFCMQLSQPIEVVPDSNPPSTMRQFLKKRAKPDCPLNVSCTSCGRALSPDPVQFRRVEECCEGLSSELAEGWFCHAEAPPSERAQPLCLFFDSRCFYMHELTIRELFGDAGWSACPNCGSTLTSGGRPVQGFIPFFCDKIKFQNSDFSVHDEIPYRTKAVWVALWGMIRSAFETSPICKLYLHSKGAAGTEETCLLLSLSPSKEPVFLLRGLGEVRDSFQPEPFYPVRYFICHQPASKAVRLWRHDFDVDFYRVSDFAAKLLSMCLEVTTMDTCTTPPTDAEFRSAFLPASLEGARRFWM